MLAQSRAIARYLAKKCDLAGKDEWEQAQVDMYVDCVDDIVHGTKSTNFQRAFGGLIPPNPPGMRSVHLEKDAEKRKEEFTKWIAERVNPHLSIIEKHVQENGSGYLVGSEVSYSAFKSRSNLNNKLLCWTGDLGWFGLLRILVHGVWQTCNFVERCASFAELRGTHRQHCCSQAVGDDSS